MPDEAKYWKGEGPHLRSISLNVDEVGVVTITENLAIKDLAAAQAALNVSAEDCPLGLTRPYVTGTSLDRIEGDMYQVSRNFSAILDEDSIGSYAVYKCATIANKEPIQTHPRFTFFAGTRDAPVNGAVFDINNNFERFKPYISAGEKITENGAQTTASTTKKNRKCGVSDYYMPIVRFEETKLVTKENLANLVEQLTYVEEDMPNSDLRPEWPLRTWLLTKCDPEWVAHQVFRLKREWSLSGPRGWDGDIYRK